MKRHPKTSSKTGKARRPESPAFKKYRGSKRGSRGGSSSISEQGEIVRLGRELNEAREQQAAAAGGLRMMSRYPSDIQSVLEAIVRTAADLCEAEYSILFRLHERKYHVACANKAAA